MNEKADAIEGARDILQKMLDLTESGEVTFCEAFLRATLGDPVAVTQPR